MYIMGVIWNARQVLEVEFRNHRLKNYDLNANISPQITYNLLTVILIGCLYLRVVVK